MLISEKDIIRKIDSWSSKQLFGNVKGLREAIIERYDNYVDGQNAIIMFNVPFYQIVVNKKLEEQEDTANQEQDHQQIIKKTTRYDLHS